MECYVGDVRGIVSDLGGDACEDREGNKLIEFINTPLNITFDGYEGERLACPVINVWNDYDDRWGKGVAISVRHGSEGVLLERRSNACKVRVGDKVGWVTYCFIKELKEGRQANLVADDYGLTQSYLEELCNEH